MKNFFTGSFLTLIVFAIVISACNNDNTKQRPQPKDYDVVKAGSTDAKADTLCFLNTQGKANKDTTLISFYINKGDVSGAMAWIPDGKDSKRGKLAGNKKDSLITAAWIYTQEGKPDSIKVQFKLIGDKLFQQPMEADLKSGQLQTNPRAAWSVIYQQTDCSKSR